MPQAPYVGAPQASPSPGGAQPYLTSNAATPDAFGANVGAAQEKFGATISNLGTHIESNVIRMQEIANDSAAKDLFVAADVEMGKRTIEFKQLERTNANGPAYAQYVKDLEAIRNKYKQNAPNDEVARKFDQDFARRVGYTITDGALHVATQNRAANRESTQAVTVNSLNHVAAAAADDKRFGTELQILQENVETEAKREGYTPEKKEAEKQKVVDAAWKTRLEAMSRSDPLRARKLLDENKDVGGLTRVALDQTINQGIIQVQSRIDADTIAAQGVGISDALVDRIKKFEGFRAKGYKDARQTSIGYGTREQVPGEVIDEKTAEIRMRDELGRAANIVDSFAPNLPQGTRDALISLTYNTGSKWTTSGLGAKIRAGDFEGAKTNFLEYNQSEGQVNPVLVNRRATELSWFGGDPTDRTEEGRRDRLLGKAKEYANKYFPNDPGNAANYEDTLQSRIATQYNLAVQATRAAQLDMRNTVFTDVLRADSPPTQLEQLSMQAQDAYSKMDAKQQDTVRTLLKRNAQVDVIRTNQTEETYRMIKGWSISDPRKFEEANLGEFQLPRSQMTELVTLQADKKRRAADMEGTQRALAFPGVRSQLNAAQITDSRTDQQKSATYNMFLGQFQAEVKLWEQENKKPIPEAEAQKISAKLLYRAPAGGFRGFFGGLEDEAFRVPEEAQQEIKTQFQSRFGREPTPLEIGGIYSRSQRR